jgi:DNA repair protein RecO (recombination protein O)
MELVSSQCIILRNQDYGERDRLVTFLTPEAGRLRGIVKGSRRLTGRGVGSFEPFSRGVIHYTERRPGDLVAIRKCDPLPPYLYLQRDYHRFLYAGYLSELIDLCTFEAGEAGPFFALLAEALETLCEGGAPRRLPLLRLRFELRFLGLLGYAPDWRQCVLCRRALLRDTHAGPEAAGQETHQFDARLGGVRCPDCRERSAPPLPLAPATLAFLERWRTAPPGTTVAPTRQALEELENAVTRHLIHHLEREPRSLALLPSLDALEPA